MSEIGWPRLRPATNADCRQVTELVYAVLGEYHLTPDPACTDADLRDIEQSYFRRAGVFYVLEEEGGSIIGSYGLYPVDSNTCELRKMYLRRDYRGKGLGRRLLEQALTEARRLGFKTITLETASVLKEAVRLYEAYGFQPYTPAHLSCRCDQAYVLELK